MHLLVILSSFKLCIYVEKSIKSSHKDSLIFWMQNYPIKPQCFATLTTKKRNEDVFRREVIRFLMKTSRYSKGHLTALGGMDKDANNIHCHLVILAEKPLKNGFVSERWKQGVSHLSFFASGDETLPNGESSNPINAAHYALNHSMHMQYAEFCPNPKTCREPVCFHRMKCLKK